MFFVLFSIFFAICIYPLTGFYADFLSINKKTLKARLIRMGISLALGVFSYFLKVLALFFLFLLLFIGISVLIRFICFKIFKNIPENKLFIVLKFIYKSGAVSILITVITFVNGYINMNSVVKTEYQISSYKLANEYNIVFLSDIHYPTVQRESVLDEKINEINSQSPDIIILGGDIVDEGTTKEKMQEAFAKLGRLKSKYGIYFVYGNHDRQRYSESAHYSEEELEDAIENNGIIILTEESVKINDDLLIIGREDLGSKSDRIRCEELISDDDKLRFILVVDHQQTDFDASRAAGADLQISGHTHSGQIFPLGLIKPFFKGRVYGEYNEGSMKLLVSSGFAGWGFPIRTQENSEYISIIIK